MLTFSSFECVDIKSLEIRILLNLGLFFLSSPRHLSIINAKRLSAGGLRGRGYSSVVEHLTADQEVPGSNPGAPSCVVFE